jgi:hypothetical protein
MKVTKFFALAIVVASIAVGMVSCAEKPKGESEVTDPTVDEKNILLDLPSFVKSVEGKKLDEIKAVLTKRGYSYVGSVERSNIFAINAKNLTIDDYTSEKRYVDCLTTKTTFLELAIKDNGGVEWAAVFYVMPQESAATKYLTIHKNAYAACKSYYPFAMDSEGELISGMQWAAMAMNLEDQYMCTNYFEILQYLYDNKMISKNELEDSQDQLINEGYKSHAEFLELIPDLKYIVEEVPCFRLDEVFFYSYAFVDEDMQEMLGITLSEGMAIAMAMYEEDNELYMPLKSPEKTNRIENSKALQKMIKMFKK